MIDIGSASTFLHKINRFWCFHRQQNIHSLKIWYGYNEILILWRVLKSKNEIHPSNVFRVNQYLCLDMPKMKVKIFYHFIYLHGEKHNEKFARMYECVKFEWKLCLVRFVWTNAHFIPDSVLEEDIILN